jgi:hypothetical protein
VFDVGDLVIVRKQVKSNTSKGISAKLLFKTKGPYRVIKKITPGSYRLQKLPFLQGLGRPGRFRKENGARMEKLPSTLILHRKVDGADTRFSQLHGDFADTPLYKWLGVLRHGAYQQAPVDSAWAFETLANMWTDAIDEDDGDSSSDDEDYNVDAGESDDDENLDETTDQQPFPFPPSVPTVSPMARPPSVPRNETTRTALQRLFRAVDDKSSDSLFFVSYTTDPAIPPIWRLGQVDYDDTSPSVAKQSGIYRVRWWTQRRDDAMSRSIVDSRFCPDVHKLRADGGPSIPHPILPQKIDKTLAYDPTLRWLADDFPLAECIIVGPFDFYKKRVGIRGTKRQAVSETHHIDNLYWQQLEQRGHLFGISTESIRENPRNPQIHSMSHHST